MDQIRRKKRLRERDPPTIDHMHTCMNVWRTELPSAYTSLIVGNWEGSLSRSITEAYRLLYAPHHADALDTRTTS
jgi:hypothetical protein